MTDTKFQYFIDEVGEFMRFMISMEEDSELNIYNLSKVATAFYEENNSRYNETQLVNQFIKKMIRRDGIKLYTAFKKFRKENNPV